MTAFNGEFTTETPFSLRSREEVIVFEERLNKYVIAMGKLAITHISLIEVYDAVCSKNNGQKIFTAMLDVQINFFMLYLDSFQFCATWNSIFSKGKLEGGSILDSDEKFFGKMDIHRYMSSYILRYRALWDKIMGIFVLLHCPHEYENFVGAKSRIRSFKKIMNKHSLADDASINSFVGAISEFDNAFRTPEAHGTGSIRKHSLSMDAIHENPSIKLLWYWNLINNAMANIKSSILLSAHPESL